MTARQPIRLDTQREGHAARRLSERYGLHFDNWLKGELFRQIEGARANDNRQPTACRISAYGHRERWLVSLDRRVLHVVIDRVSTVVITFLPLDGSTTDHHEP
ncbi:hypothetical protein [Azospirillum rugosum]|uniref:DUF4258 domain-containing protein n=1 Tax=Azospirillum rugosum TaxID=416170 RepID=A0ABS4SEC1_9PROT|nr:hypothetical protein [Azospirillum rugosum]MBP2290750.1 hypothetical protein [Azospirillum rugosum]MDQ0525639.1 hypothetical protein [Azospirillum rugosum]